MNVWAAVLIAPLPGIIGLVMFLTLTTTIVYLTAVAIGVYFCLRHYEKHHYSDKYDDRLTDARMVAAREWLVRRWKK